MPDKQLCLKDFINLIAAMPTEYQSFTAKRISKNWASILQWQDRAGRAMRRVWGNREAIELCRADVKSLAQANDLDCFVMATLIWGYPRGMRSDHAVNICHQLPDLVKLLSKAKKGIKNWRRHFEKVGNINGLGISTYTKFLYFLGAKVEGRNALILDDTISRVGRRGVFEEFSREYSDRTYVAYLGRMHELATTLGVSAESLEFFLFEFGLNLNRPTGER